jgi:two-component system, NarL family, sensor histidine kinase UhpB
LNNEDYIQLVRSSSGIGVWDWDVRTDLVKWTPELEVIFGLESGAVQTYKDFRQRVHPEDKPRLDRQFEAVVHHQPRFELEFRIIRPSGEVRWVYCTGAGTWDSHGQLTRILGNNLDITERKVAEFEIARLNRELARRVSELETIFDASPVGLAIAEEPEGQHIHGNPTLEQLTGIAAGGELSRRARPPAIYRILQQGREVPVDELPMQRACRGETIRGMELDIVRPDGSTVSVLSSAVPLRDEQDRPRGAVGVFLDLTERKQAETDLKRLNVELEHRVLKRTAALKQLNEGLRQEVARRQQVEEALSTSEHRYRSVVEDQTEVISRFRPDWTFTFVNEIFCRFFGMTSQELMGRRWQPQVVEEDLPMVEEQLRSLAPANSVVVIENRVYAANGTVRWMQFVNRGLFDAGGCLVEIQAVGRDITDRKQAEQALRESERRFMTIFQSSPAPMAIGRLADGHFLDANDAFVQFFGYARQELIGHAPEELGLWHSFRRSDIVRGIGKDKQKQVLEMQGRRKNGELRDLMVSVTLIEQANEVCILGILMDITDRKRSEAAMRASHVQLQNLAGRLQTVREEERAHVAREIHDVLAQELTRLKMDLVWLKRQLGQPMDEIQQSRLAEKLNQMVGLTNTAIESVQKIATELRPVVLDSLGLAAALEWQAEDFQARTGIACVVQVPDQPIDVDRERATAAFRIVQESLTNVARHAHATRVDIRLECEVQLWPELQSETNAPEIPVDAKEAKPGPDESVPRAVLHLVVSDNGCGILPAQVNDLRSIGLLGMRERAALLGGWCHITALREGGTAVRLQIPLP